MLGQVESHRHLVSDYAKDNPNDQYLSNFYFKSDVKVPVVSTCGALWYSSPSKVTEECAKTMSLYGYEPANVVCPYTCTGDDGGDGDIVECIDKTICEKGSTEMKFKVTGTTCEESSNTQGDKFECTDNLPISFPAYINLSAKGQVYFEGMVDKGDIITLSNGGNKFKADTDAVVKASPTGVTYQSLTYHSSCSKNLFIGDSFGAIQLLEFTNSKQGTITCTPVTSPPLPSPSSTPSVAPTSNPSEIPSSKPSLSPIEPDNPCKDPFLSFPSDTDELDRLEYCCSDLFDEDERPPKDLCCKLPVMPNYCPCTDEPSPSPSPTPSSPSPTSCYEKCAVKEQDNFRFLLKIKKSDSGVDIPVVKSCGWLAKKAKIKQETICDSHTISYLEYKPAIDVCTNTCNVCPCDKPSTPPSIPPTILPRTPSPEPSSSPTFIPFPPHSPPPSSEPSTPPSPSPVSCPEICAVKEQDDFQFLLKMRKTDGGVDIPIVRSCGWLAKKPQFEQHEICYQSTDSYYGYKPAIDVCTSTCCVCPCTHEPSIVPTTPPTPSPTKAPVKIDENPTPEPSSKPSSKPSSAPSPEPSSSPTFIPFPPHSPPPSSEPSTPPSPSPVSCPEICAVKEQDDFQFLLKMRKTDGGVDIPIVRSCGWLAKKPQFEQHEICYQSTDSYYGYKPAIDVCTSTCCVCPCTHEPSTVPTTPPTPSPTKAPVKIDENPTPAPVCIPCDPYLDPECPFECPPDVCEERPEEFYFRFSGGSCDDSNNSQDYDKFSCKDINTINQSNSHYLVFTSAKSDGEVYFEGWVDPGEVVTLTNSGRFQADMKVDVYAGKKKWLKQSLEYHSSCSQNLFNGDIFGAVTLMGFKSYYQNSKCTPTNCDTDPPCEPEMCEERPDEFFFKLTGGSCSESLNDQGDKFVCVETGSYDNTVGKYIEFTDTYGYEIYYKGFASPNQVVTLIPESSRFPADMRIRVYTAANKKYKLQDIQYHSSCSKNLFNADSFGAVTLVGFKSYAQDVKCF